MNKLQLIALDGPSGAGKSTAAKLIAQTLGWDYLDTGAMYRATALALARAKVTLEDGPALAQALDHLQLEQRGSHIFLNGEDVSEAIRTPEVTLLVTPVSADARVRDLLVAQQRKIGATGHWVVDGRDIGTVVFTNACCKIFLTASVAARAQRRFLEMETKGIPTTLQEVAKDIERRDHADSTRAVAPLMKADDAVELDSSDMNLEQVVSWIVAHRIAPMLSELLQPLRDARDEAWEPISAAALLGTTVGFAIIALLAATNADGWTPFVDGINLVFHESGHPIFGIFGDLPQWLGGTLMQLLVPLMVTGSFWFKRQAIGTAWGSFWAFQNLLNIGRYMSDARAQELPLVGGGEHDWTELFGRWGLLSHDMAIGHATRTIGWIGMLTMWLWLVWRWRRSSVQSQ